MSVVTARATDVKKAGRKRTLVVICPVPPPHNGPTIFFEMLLESKVREIFDLVHIDTIRHQPNPNMGALNFPALFLALSNVIQVYRANTDKSISLVYMLISPSFLGLLRDSVFIFVSKLFRRRVIVHLHSGGQIREVCARYPAFARAIIKGACQKVDRAVVLHPAFTEALQDLIPTERIVVIPNGVSDPHLATHSSGLSAKKSAPLIVTYLSNLQEGKGYRDFLEAVSLIPTEPDSVRFLIAGTWFDDSDRRKTMSWIREHKLGSAIEFLGPVVGQAKADLLLRSHVFVFPPWSPEGQPLVLLEAMAAGLPIVTTNQGVLPEIVAHGRNGLVVPKHDPAALAAAITCLLGDEELRERMSSNNRADYLQHHTAEQCMQRMVDLFEEVSAN